MNVQKDSIFSRFFPFLRKKSITFVKFLVFRILTLRIILLKIKHYSPRIVKRFFKQLITSPRTFKGSNALSKNIFKQIFVWDISENTIKIRLILDWIMFLKIHLPLSI